MEVTASARRRTGLRDADGMAVASFALGMVGLLVLNLVLGPVSLVLAALALKRATGRRSLALSGLVLGIADVVVYAILFAADNSVAWTFSG
ncbi:DUF4190 domain-containing protein [Streptomyces sp. Ru73]|uniref:DUF4190 domain-containing protein n=1 Tax=Streptomyces sp. Ru73 TaxID=2080748 RepID=UPI000CDD2B72|nr:DUF4190 domain-containing protein [Streptomyces sp. Ru73]POX37462.1 DUF4190 domain-containing protein [Streptomyces sp. Ru73]